MSMTRLIITDDAFHGGEPSPGPYVRIDAHKPLRGGLYAFIPFVAPPSPTQRDRDAPAGEVAPTTPHSPAGISSRRPREP